jgi:hypothetical protein
MSSNTLNRNKVNHELKKLGLGGLEDRNLMQQLAFFMTNHSVFRSLLMSTKPDQRRNAYEALRPHLSFAPKPLEVYEMEGRQKAEREQLPGYNAATGEIIPFKTGEVGDRLEELAQDAIRETAFVKGGGFLTLVCRKCTLEQSWRAKTRKQGDKDAMRDGWRMQEGKAYCPKHVPSRLTMGLECSVCERREKIRAWDEQDGYSHARLLGWIIGDAATCPRCAAKPVLLQ